LLPCTARGAECSRQCACRTVANTHPHSTTRPCKHEGGGGTTTTTRRGHLQVVVGMRSGAGAGAGAPRGKDGATVALRAARAEQRQKSVTHVVVQSVPRSLVQLLRLLQRQPQRVAERVVHKHAGRDIQRAQKQRQRHSPCNRGPVHRHAGQRRGMQQVLRGGGWGRRWYAGGAATESCTVGPDVPHQPRGHFPPPLPLQAALLRKSNGAFTEAVTTRHRRANGHRNRRGAPCTPGSPQPRPRQPASSWLHTFQRSSLSPDNGADGEGGQTRGLLAGIAFPTPPHRGDVLCSVGQAPSRAPQGTPCLNAPAKHNVQHMGSKYGRRVKGHRRRWGNGGAPPAL
jgi:hypothetical protein